MRQEERSKIEASELELKPDQIHIWYVDVDVEDALLLDLYRSWLTRDEHQRHQKFYFAQHRQQFLVTRALVRYGLSHYIPAIAPEEWHFDANEYGRPVIANHDWGDGELEFNLSHTSGFIAMAFSCVGELGVDVENIHRRTDPSLLADRFFSPQEATELRSLPEVKQSDRFFDYWTLKESYIKARGMGLSIPLDSFSFDLSNSSISLSVERKANDTAEGWQFWQLKAHEDYKIALAHRFNRPPQQMHLKVFNVIPGEHIKTVDLSVIRTSK